MALKVLNIDNVQLDEQVACNASNHTCIWVRPYRLQPSTILAKGLVGMERIQESCRTHTVHIPYTHIWVCCLATATLAIAKNCSNKSHW